MAALAGEPWRGLTKVRTQSGAGTTNTYVTVSVEDVVPSTVTGSRGFPYWDFAAGASITLRLEVEKTGTGGLVPANYKVSVRVPGGGSNIGSSSPTSSTTALPASGSANSITLRFDDDPLDANVGTATFGMLEVFLELYSDATTKACDSRGNNAAGYATVDWARGYFRAGMVLLDTAVSNVALGGNDPRRFYTGDPLYLRMITTPPYRSAAAVMKLQDSDAATPILRTSGTLNSTTGTWDASFTGLGGVVDTGFTWGGDDLRLELASTDPWSNGDAEFVGSPTAQPPNVDVVGATPTGILAAYGRVGVDTTSKAQTTNYAPTAGGTQ